MIIIYYSDKKLPKRLHFLEADMIKNKTKQKNTEDLRSAQRIHLSEHMFQMTAVVPQTPDLYLWGFLKDLMYEYRPQSIAELSGHHPEDSCHQEGRVCQGD